MNLHTDTDGYLQRRRGRKKRLVGSPPSKKTKQYWKEIWRQIEAAPPTLLDYKERSPKTVDLRQKIIIQFTRIGFCVLRAMPCVVCVYARRKTELNA